MLAMSAVVDKEVAPYHPDLPDEVIPPFTAVPEDGELDSPKADEVLPKVSGCGA